MKKGKLNDLFQEGLGLTRDKEDRIWAGLVTKQANEAQAWASFMMVMLSLRRYIRMTAQSSIRFTGNKLREF